MQWLRDGLRLFDSAPAIEELAATSDPEQPVIFVPGFVGLGAPHWVPEARGVLFGLTRGTTAADLGRATLEGVAFQVADLIEAPPRRRRQCRLRRCAWTAAWPATPASCRCQADVLGIPVFRRRRARRRHWARRMLAGLAAGVWPDVEHLRKLTAAARRFDPSLAEEERTLRLKHWRKAVQAVIAYYQDEPRP